MSRHKLKARDKRTLKNSRDGLVERNLAGGADAKVTDHETEEDLRGDTLEQTRFSQVGKSSQTAHPSHNHKQQRRYQQNQPKTETSATPAPPEQTGSSPTAAQLETADSRAEDSPQVQPQDNTGSIPHRPPKLKPPQDRQKRYQLNAEHKAATPIIPEAGTPEPSQEPIIDDVSHTGETAPTHTMRDTPRSALRTDTQSGLKLEKTETAPIKPKQRSQKRPQTVRQETAHADASVNDAPNTAPVQSQPQIQQSAKSSFNERHDSLLQPTPSDKPAVPAEITFTSKHNNRQTAQSETRQSESTPTDSGTTSSDVDTTPISQSEPALPTQQESTPQTPLKQSKQGKLQFARDETVPTAPATPTRADVKQQKRYGKAQKQADKAALKLETAKSKLPAKKKLRSERVFNQETGKVKRKLYFENEVKSQSQHIKGATPLRPVKAAGNLTIAHAHRKLYQVERENVGTEAAHKGEILAEGGIRSALRFSKTAPYRRVQKLERTAQKKTINAAYHKALADNPKLQSNFLSRTFQKRKIKKDYAKAAREAKKNAERVKKAGSAASEAAKAVGGAIKRHPIAAVAIVLTALLLFALMALIGAFGGAGSGGLGGILSASYLADDVSIDNAELAYTEWETDLLLQIAGAETSHPGYDEYRYNIGEISHNPYELMAYLTVKYQNFTYAGIEADLRALFAEQYSLTFTPTNETRYADPADADEDGDYEPYDYRVMTVTLTARNFSEVVASHLSGEQAAHFALLLQTKGSRQYLANPFDFAWQPYITSYYGYRIHPISGGVDIHRGVDIGVAAGTPIKSGQDGTVTFAGYSGDYGNVAVIENADGLVSKYAHCDTLSVTTGQSVNTGDVIGTVGNTGNSTGPHLHLEILKNGEYLNPAYFCDSGTFSLTPSYGYAGAPMGDGSYAALMEVALQFDGWPYVWGGSSPETSFDCSGLVSYCLRVGGVKDVGRLGAWGLYNICIPVDPSEAMPGDLIFFHSTYSGLNPVTHVGIYCGGNLMYDAGNPIGYTRIDTAYWQQHFYAFGRVN